MQLDFDKDEIFSSPALTFSLPGADADSFLNKVIRWERNYQAKKYTRSMSVEYAVFLFGLIVLSLGTGMLFRSKSRELDTWVKGWFGYAVVVVLPVFGIDILWKMILRTQDSPAFFWFRAALVCILGVVVCVYAFMRGGGRQKQAASGEETFRD